MRTLQECPAGTVQTNKQTLFNATKRLRAGAVAEPIIQNHTYALPGLPQTALAVLLHEDNGQ